MAHAVSVFVLIGAAWLAYPARAAELASGECPRTFERATLVSACRRRPAADMTICDGQDS